MGNESVGGERGAACLCVAAWFLRRFGLLEPRWLWSPLSEFGRQNGARFENS